MKTKQKSSLKKSDVSDKLSDLWSEFSYRPCPISIEEYILIIDVISRVYRNAANLVFDKLKKPSVDVEDCLYVVQEELSWLFRMTDIISYECRKYLLTRRQKRILIRMCHKNENIWIRFDKKVLEIQKLNDELFTFNEQDYLAEEVLYQKNFSVILKDFEKYSFQKN